MIKLITITLALLAFQTTNAKGLKPLEVGLNLNGNTGVFAPSIYAIKYFNLKKGKETKFNIGGGLRFTSSNTGGCKDFITAPAKLTGSEATIDTIGFDNASSNALNLMLALNYRITRKLNVEFNIDLLGASFGAEKDVFLRNKPGIDVNNAFGKAKPTTTNVLLVGDNDLGTLSSELLVSYKLLPNFKVKLGGGFLFTEHTLTTDKYTNLAGVSVDNNRFRNKNMAGLLGFAYTIN